ncbi:MAG TPA: hypothetical protein VGG34_06565 [Opitutaceae bacterium]|jgi:hypothetical protein
MPTENRAGARGVAARWAPKLGLMLAAPFLFLVALELGLAGFGRPST